jgi:insertion element IS1 protein InsB
MPTETPAREPIPACPRCHATHGVRNGSSRSGEINFLCRGCNRRFVAAPKKGRISEERRLLIRKLLLERLSLRAIVRATGVSRTWLQGFVNGLYREQTPWEPAAEPPKQSLAG